MHFFLLHHACISGKSSRVPQLLQSELNGPIICTQPRRLAVVSIARHVSASLGAQLGREVGFRIGQKSVAHSKTKILFTTAGLLLEDIRANVSSGGQ
jgi:HrpA-like RNA helicase